MSSESEKNQINIEKNINRVESHVDHVEIPERETTKLEKEHGKESQVENLRASAIEKAVSTEEHARKNIVEKKSEHPVFINKQLKDMAYSRALTRTRKHLSAPSRLLSTIVHSKALDRPSEAIGKTIARPSSMLGGAFVALVGTSLLLWITKKQGYEYNYLAVIVFFAGGMIVGLALESLYRLVRRRP